MKYNTFGICADFGVEIVGTKEIKTGIINDTFVAIGKDGKKYILQEINNNVFKDVDGLMQNVEKVTTYLQTKIKQDNGNPSRETLNLLLNQLNNRPYVKVKDSEGKFHYFRMYNFIENASTYDEANTQLLFEAGKGFGKFQRQLDDFDASQLSESIPDFHNTNKRLETFLHSLSESYKTKDAEFLKKIKPCCDFAFKYSSLSDLIMQPLANKTIPTRVVHNDTKLNNVMIDNQTGKAICVIDLDTIMPGSMLFDYGDAIRFAGNSGKEDDEDLTNISLDLEKFKSFTSGFMSEVAPIITDEELKLMPYAPAVLSYELGLRFLTDYLDGNKYFKCDSRRPDHNLERTKAQFKLTESILENIKEMQTIINSSYQECIQAKESL